MGPQIFDTGSLARRLPRTPKIFDWSPFIVEQRIINVPVFDTGSNPVIHVAFEDGDNSRLLVFRFAGSEIDEPALEVNLIHTNGIQLALANSRPAGNH